MRSSITVGTATTTEEGKYNFISTSTPNYFKPFPLQIKYNLWFCLSQRKIYRM
jgi:hypothetical protein